MKIELHAHTSEVSPCSGIRAADIISGYHNAGYDAVVITDHFNFYVLEGFNINNETDRVKRYMLGYELARKAAAKYGMKAILGVEVCLRHEKGGDLLLYGIRPETLCAHPYLYDYSMQQLRDICDKEDILLFKAHPFRGVCDVDVTKLDGAEVYNGCPRHDSRNDLALSWAKEHNLIFSSGGDCHLPEDIGRAGIVSDILPENSLQLRDLLRSGNYSLIRAQE